MLSWSSSSAAFSARRVYRLTVSGSTVAVPAAGVELARHGRVLMIAQHQPGTDLRAGRVVSMYVWLPALSVVERGDAPTMLGRTLASRVPGATLTRTEAATISEGARDAMWAAAGDRGNSTAYSVARLNTLTQRTATERAEDAVRDIASAASQAGNVALDAARAAADRVEGIADDAASTARNTVTYTKMALGMLGAAAVLVAAKQAGLLRGVTR